jgi:hypothetical protein
MKNTLAALLISLSLTAYAAPEVKFSDVKKPVKCADVKQLFIALKTSFGETVAWTSLNEMLEGRTTIGLFKNQKTGSWTLVEFDQDIACVLATGQDPNV